MTTTGPESYSFCSMFAMSIHVIVCDYTLLVKRTGYQLEAPCGSVPEAPGSSLRDTWAFHFT